MTISELKEKALAATPGPTVSLPKPVQTKCPSCKYPSRFDGKCVNNRCKKYIWLTPDNTDAENMLAFRMAANPATIIELIERYENLYQFFKSHLAHMGSLNQRLDYPISGPLLQTVQALEKFGPDVPLGGGE